MKSIRESNLLIVGLVRDAAKTLASELFQLKKSFESFKNIRWLIIESDSKDKTIDELSNISNTVKNFQFITLGNLSAVLPKRTERLAFCRNRYLQEMRENSTYSHIDYVAIADLDGMNNLLTSEAVESCWSRNDWDVCTANQLGPYFDIWALRHPIWSPNDCWEQCRFLEWFGTLHEQAKRSAVYSKQITIPPTLNWIEVDSAFGGLAIYKRFVLNEGQYFGVGIDGQEVCEHPFLHQTIRNNGGKIFINPRLINTGYTEHTQHLNSKQKLLYIQN